jgi:predicted nucleotidyltransferase
LHSPIFPRHAMQRTIAFSEEHQQLLKRIKSTILALEPGAEVYLYGSRARGDAEEDSDWDVLVLLDGEITYERQRQIRNALYDIEITTLMLISTIIRPRTIWHTDRLIQATPFYKNVRADALTL